MDELVAFINARLDEVESLAKQALPWQTGSRYEGQPAAWVSHASLWGHPQAALNSVKADREILDWLGHQDRVYGDYGVIETLERVVRFRAAIFGGHRDYRAVWCPECEDGLVRVAGCNCGDGLPPYGHEPLCGWEQCPNGCWERLHPQQGQPSAT